MVNSLLLTPTIFPCCEQCWRALYGGPTNFVSEWGERRQPSPQQRRGRWSMRPACRTRVQRYCSNGFFPWLVCIIGSESLYRLDNEHKRSTSDGCPSGGALLICGSAISYLNPKTKYTAAMRQRPATMWFHFTCMSKAITEKRINTTKVITSCKILSCISEKGPPFPSKPMRLAGTCKQYSKKAIPHDNAITAIIGKALNHENSAIFKWPYHANVIKTFEAMRSNIV